MNCENSNENYLLSHHAKASVCLSRAKYRNSRRERAVKVYTINLESYYLIIQNVPSVGVADNLRDLCEQYGNVEKFELLKDYPREEFTDVYLVKYQWFAAARNAKKYLDEKSFFGSLLHVCYAPEHETISETREKLGDRRKYVASFRKSGNLKSNEPKLEDQNNIGHNTKDLIKADTSYHSTNSEPEQQPITYIWAGKEYTVYPSQQKTEPASPSQPPKITTPSPSLQASAVHIQKRISKLNVPNARVSFKRRKRI